MSDNTYTVDLLVKGPATVYKVDREGEDWIEIQALFDTVTDINLAWTSDSGVATSASGLYFDPPTIGHRLIITGVIENARGSIGRDFIQGNELGNRLYGDQTVFDLGLDDTVWGGAGSDSIYGGTANDELSGGDDDDYIFGDSGADEINGGAGDDQIAGGADPDIMYGGGDAGDVLYYARSDAGVSVLITHGSTTTGRGGDSEGDTIGQFRNVIGSAHDDAFFDTVEATLAFGYNDNRFVGGAGDDLLSLGGGSDVGLGGKGSDTLFGGAERDQLAGNLGNDRLLGDEGNDELSGDQGNDWLYDGAGDDDLRGGSGTDRFIFTNRGPVRRGDQPDADLIRDVVRADGDRIVLRFIDADSTQAGRQAFDFRGIASFTGTAGELIVVDDGLFDSLLVLGDINGDRRSDLAFTVEGVADLRAGDFILT